MVFAIICIAIVLGVFIFLQMIICGGLAHEIDGIAEFHNILAEKVELLEKKLNGNNK